MKLIKQPINYLLLLLIALFTLSPLNAMAESQRGQSIDYLAIGDSLAAGVLSNNTLGNGYPFFIEKGIEDEQGIDVDLVNEGVPGYTTENVLNQLKNNGNNIRESFADAEFITIDAGANDLLQAIDIENIDPENPGEAIADVTKAIEQIRSNMNEILVQINELNPDAPIYVMGYYNAMPYVEDMQDLITIVMDMMNNKIEEVATNAGAMYIPTFESFVGKYESYLPNPNNIHPNEEGYQVIANLFLEEILPIELPDTIKPSITLKGDNHMELVIGEEYVESGATAKDNIDGDLSDVIEISGEVNAKEIGKYTVTYTVSDEAGNMAKATRTVNIVNPKVDPDTDAPVITLKGAEEIEQEIGEEYIEPGATAEDNVDGDLTKMIEITGEVNTEKAGEYTINYRVSDKAGNTTTATRTVSILGNKDGDQGLEGERASNVDKNRSDISHKTKKVTNSFSVKGEKLPDTASNNPLFILMGSLMTVLGGVIILIRKIVV